MSLSLALLYAYMAKQGNYNYGVGKIVYPGSITKDANLTQAISDYYDKISEKLQELNAQENN